MMIVFKIIVTTTALMALVSAWSTQIPHFYHAYTPSPPTTLPLPFRTFFQDSSPESRFYLHQSQFRQPVQLFPSQNIRLTSLPLARPHPLTTSPYPIPIQSHILPPQMDSFQQSSSLRQDTMPTDEQHHHHHHHHHVFYYYYLPSNDETRTITDKNRGLRQPCNDNPPPTPGCVPAYIPPQPPQPPLPPTPQPIMTTTQTPPLIPSPCDDDTVVVDNVNYFPFGRGVTPATAIAENSHNGKEYAGSSNNSYRSHTQLTSRPEIKSNFILANYLLPPDK